MMQQQLKQGDVQACIEQLREFVCITPNQNNSRINWSEINQCRDLAERSVLQLETIFLGNSKAEIEDPLSCGLLYYPRY